MFIKTEEEMIAYIAIPRDIGTSELKFVSGGGATGVYTHCLEYRGRENAYSSPVLAYRCKRCALIHSIGGTG